MERVGAWQRRRELTTVGRAAQGLAPVYTIETTFDLLVAYGRNDDDALRENLISAGIVERHRERRFLRRHLLGAVVLNQIRGE